MFKCTGGKKEILPYLRRSPIMPLGTEGMSFINMKMYLHVVLGGKRVFFSASLTKGGRHDLGTYGHS